MIDPFTDGSPSVRDELMARLMVHAGRSLESVKRALMLLSARTTDDLDDRQLRLLVAYLDQPVFERDAL